MEPSPANNEDILDSWVLHKYPYIGYLISAVYLLIAKVLLPKYMENKQPYSLKGAIRIYNLIQVFLNGLALKIALRPGLLPMLWREHCAEFTHDVPNYQDAAELVGLYAFIKLFDLVDTIFIVLKKKTSQLSFLHLFHHSMVVILGYTAVAGREKLAIPVTILNGFVHVIMYSYYFITTFESQRWVTKYKKYVTQLQLIQFSLISLFFAYAFTRGCPCGLHTKLLWSFVLIVLIYQFSKFYYLEYLRKRRKND